MNEQRVSKFNVCKNSTNHCSKKAVPGNTSKEQPGNVQSGALEVSADTLLSVAAEEFLSRRRLAKATDDNQERLETAVAAFIDVIGGSPLRKYLPIHMRDFALIRMRIGSQVKSLYL